MVLVVETGARPKQAGGSRCGMLKAPSYVAARLPRVPMVLPEVYLVSDQLSIQFLSLGQKPAELSYGEVIPGAGVSCRVSLLDSEARCLSPSAALLLSPVVLRRWGLLVRAVNVSRMVTWTFSVRRSSKELLVERGFGWPDVDRLCELSA